MLWLPMGYQPGHLLPTVANYLSNGWGGGGCSTGRRWQLGLEYIHANRESLNEQGFPELRRAPGGENVM